MGDLPAFTDGSFGRSEYNDDAPYRELKKSFQRHQYLNENGGQGYVWLSRDPANLLTGDHLTAVDKRMALLHALVLAEGTDPDRADRNARRFNAILNAEGLSSMSQEKFDVLIRDLALKDDSAVLFKRACVSQRIVSIFRPTGLSESWSELRTSRTSDVL